ncbi:AraC family transcriptional regulator [Nisaea acidiphila]|uniref:AraC family transcriptional regulator n=1 Tax=Nisaea acidiphila TaxID=1862145 RepID=A0A9J7ATX8_9PROT|nr:AraC family transcriptional regulator [Nisaea acidiphila]UUX49945.1 AraC family transcriptional regulator [Nisaea acidiphila]
MELTPAVYRFDKDHRLFSRADGSAVDGWKAAFRSEEVGDGCRVGAIDCFIPADETHIVEGPSTFSVSLFLQGAGQFELEDGQAFEFGPGSMFLFHTVGETRGRDSMYGNNRLRGAEFRFSLPVLSRAGIASVNGVEGAQRVGSGSVALFMHRPLTGSLRLIAEQTVDCPLEGLARRLYLKSKSLEVLAHVVAMYEASKGAPANVTARDRRRVEEAAKILRERCDEPWTISRLSQECAINERKLKEGFRLVLGETVLSVLERARVERAQGLMRDEALNVAETALAVGYSNPSHFAKVFRRLTGTAPGLWRRAV